MSNQPQAEPEVETAEIQISEFNRISTNLNRFIGDGSQLDLNVDNYRDVSTQKSGGQLMTTDTEKLKEIIQEYPWFFNNDSFIRLHNTTNTLMNCELNHLEIAANMRLIHFDIGTILAIRGVIEN